MDASSAERRVICRGNAPREAVAARGNLEVGSAFQTGHLYLHVWASVVFKRLADDYSLYLHVSSLVLVPLFMRGWCMTIYICLRVAWLYTSRHSLLSVIIPHTVQPSSLSPSSNPTSYFHSHHPPSFTVHLSLRRMPIPLQPPILDFLHPVLLSLWFFNFFSRRAL